MTKKNKDAERIVAGLEEVLAIVEGRAEPARVFVRRGPDRMDEFERAEAHAAERRAVTPKAVAAECDGGLLTVRFANETALIVPLHLIQGLRDASPADLGEIEVSPAGLGLHFPRIDADVYLPALLQGAFGSKVWMSQLGAKGGRPRKVQA